MSWQIRVAAPVPGDTLRKGSHQILQAFSFFDNDTCGLLPNGFVLGAGSHSLLVIGFGKGKNTAIWYHTELKILLMYEIA